VGTWPYPYIDLDLSSLNRFFKAKKVTKSLHPE